MEIEESRQKEAKSMGKSKGKRKLFWKEMKLVELPKSNLIECSCPSYLKLISVERQIIKHLQKHCFHVQPELNPEQDKNMN